MASSWSESDSSYTSSSTCSTPSSRTPLSTSSYDASSSFRLIHRTNHQGYFILPEPASRHFPVTVIWTQVDWSSPYKPQHCAGCCPRLGRRVIPVAESDFQDHTSHWYLLGAPVMVKGHDVYYKFVVSPLNYGRRASLVLRRHYVLQDLVQYMGRLRQTHLRRHAPGAIHIHVGLVLEVLRTPLDTRQAILDYQLACCKAIDECDDEDELDEWLDRARDATTMTTRRTLYQPMPRNLDIPEVILVDRSCGAEAATWNRKDRINTVEEDATRDAYATTRG